MYNYAPAVEAAASTMFMARPRACCKCNTSRSALLSSSLSLCSYVIDGHELHSQSGSFVCFSLEVFDSTLENRRFWTEWKSVSSDFNIHFYLPNIKTRQHNIVVLSRNNS